MSNLCLNDGKTYLVTSDVWFYAPDGEQYRSVWGKVQVHAATHLLGLVPSRSANWYVQVGVGEGSVILAGCMVHLATMCEKPPKIVEGTYTEEKTGRVAPVNFIYITPNN